MPSSRGSSLPRDWTHISYVSCIGRRVLYHQRHLGRPLTTKWEQYKYVSTAQSCLNLCNPMDCSRPGFSVHGFSRQEYWSGLSFPPPPLGNIQHSYMYLKFPSLDFHKTLTFYFFSYFSISSHLICSFLNSSFFTYKPIIVHLFDYTYPNPLPKRMGNRVVLFPSVGLSALITE